MAYLTNWQAEVNNCFQAQNMNHQSKDMYLWNVQADWNMCFNLTREYAGYV